MTDFDRVFRELRSVLQPYIGRLDCKTDTPTELYLDTRHLQKNRKPLFFGAVQVKKSYVSFHLMPVYTDPDLLDSVSPELKSRMQGKSCFNFKKVEPSLLRELEQLTNASFERYQQHGYV